MKKTMLKLSQKMQLAQWLQARVHRYQTERPSNDVVAQRASKELKFDISKGNILGIRRELEIKWPKSGGNTSPRSYAKRWGRILRASRTALYLLRQFDEPIPDQLIDDCEMTHEEAKTWTLPVMMEDAKEKEVARQEKSNQDRQARQQNNGQAQ